MAVDIGPKDTSPKRPFNFTLRRRQCAQYSRSADDRRNFEADVPATGQIECCGRIPAAQDERHPFNVPLQSSRSFAANAARLQLHALDYNLGNFPRTLATPQPIKDWSWQEAAKKVREGVAAVGSEELAPAQWRGALFPHQGERGYSRPVNLG
jgi:hypothetical protein